MKNILCLATMLLVFFLSKIQAQSEATFYTTKGNFVVKLYDSSMPITAGNFYNLVKAKFYDGVIFHRVINNFMIQGGDPTGTGSGGPGYTIQDEFVTGISNVQKTISMANTGSPNSGGSQFFINLVNNTHLDFDKPPLTSAHPVFGITISNFTVVQNIGLVATNAQDRPLVDVVMDSIRITKVGPLAIGQTENPLAEVNIYPNPIEENSLLEISQIHDKDLNVFLLNQEGNVMFSKKVLINSGKYSIKFQEMNFSDLPIGNYFIGISNGKKTMYEKILKSN